LDFGFGSIAFLVEVVEHVSISDGLLHGFVVVGPGFDAFNFLELGLGGLGVVPEIRG
jgi:hypothetical protein